MSTRRGVVYFLCVRRSYRSRECPTQSATVGGWAESRVLMKWVIDRKTDWDAILRKLGNVKTRRVFPKLLWVERFQSGPSSRIGKLETHADFSRTMGIYQAMTVAIGDGGRASQAMRWVSISFRCAAYGGRMNRASASRRRVELATSRKW